MKYTLFKSIETNRPHYGLKVEAYYVEDLNYPFPMHKIEIFNHHAPITVEADVVEVEGLPFLCPKTKEGLYCMGYGPEQQYNKLMGAVRM